MKTTATRYPQTARPQGAGTNRPLGTGILRIALGFLTAAALFTGCGKEDHDPEAEPTLSISPALETISFDADGTESFTFEVTTNQPIWLPYADQDWCKITLDAETSTFTVTALPNLSETPPAPATITVTAGKAAPLTITATQKASAYDIYLAGSYYPDAVSDEVVCYWKNGELTRLTEPGNGNSYCTSMTASDGSLYLAGAGDGAACYWKDGQKVIVNGFANLQSIAVENGSVYLLDDGKYWNDGKTVEIAAKDFTSKAIAVAGGDVYVAGQLYLSVFGHSANLAYVWNNGGAKPLKAQAETSTDSDAVCAVAAGGSVYIGGFYRDDNTDIQHACYWKDKVCTPLRLPEGTSAFYAAVDAICVEDGTVYTAGFYDDNGQQHLCYWVNEKCMELALPAETSARVVGIAVAGGKVYVAGSYYLDGSDRWGYWVDGKWKELELPDGASGVHIAGIAVMK